MSGYSEACRLPVGHANSCMRQDGTRMAVREAAHAWAAVSAGAVTCFVFDPLELVDRPADAGDDLNAWLRRVVGRCD